MALQGGELGILLGLWEATRLFLFKYRLLSATEPLSLSNLYVAGVLNYGIIFLLLGFLVGLLWMTLRMLRFLQGLVADSGAFFLAGAIGLMGGVSGITYVNTTLLYGISPTHPLALGADLACVIAALILMAGLTVLLTRVRSSLARLGVRPRTLWLILFAVPAVFTAGGIVRNLFSQETAERVYYRQAVDREKGRSSGPPDTLPLRPTDPKGRPNVVLITVEAFRPADVNCYGYRKRVTTPTIDRLAAGGARFTQCYTQASWTRPSITTLLTSLYPQEHGCTLLTSVLGEGTPSLPAVLSQAGYRSVMFTTNGNTIDPGFRFDQVISRFPRPERTTISALSAQPFLVGNLVNKIVAERLQILVPSDVSVHDIDAQRVNSRIRRWFEEAAPEPFFLHVHYLDTHAPYLDHPHRLLQINTPAKWNRERRLYYYDHDILFVDGAIAGLVQMLREMGIEKNTILVITGDHGEEFLEHGGWEHQRTLYQEVLHVPLVLVAPGRLPEGAIVTSPVRNIDIAPTILDLCHLGIPPSFQGRSLVPLIGRGETAPRPVLANLQTPIDRWDSLQQGERKFIRRQDLGLHEFLFDLSEDPGETVNLVSSQPERADSLRQELASWLAQLEQRALTRKTVTLTPQEREQLKALGYVR